MTTQEWTELTVLIEDRLSQLGNFVKRESLTIDLRNIDINLDDMVSIDINGKNEVGEDVEIFVGFQDGEELFGLYNLTNEEDESMFTI